MEIEYSNFKDSNHKSLKRIMATSSFAPSITSHKNNASPIQRIYGPITTMPDIKHEPVTTLATSRQQSATIHERSREKYMGINEFFEYVDAKNDYTSTYKHTAQYRDELKRAGEEKQFKGTDSALNNEETYKQLPLWKQYKSQTGFSMSNTRNEHLSPNSVPSAPSSPSTSFSKHIKKPFRDNEKPLIHMRSFDDENVDKDNLRHRLNIEDYERDCKKNCPSCLDVSYNTHSDKTQTNSVSKSTCHDVPYAIPVEKAYPGRLHEPSPFISETVSSVGEHAFSGRVSSSRASSYQTPLEPKTTLKPKFHSSEYSIRTSASAKSVQPNYSHNVMKANLSGTRLRIKTSPNHDYSDSAQENGDRKMTDIRNGETAGEALHPVDILPSKDDDEVAEYHSDESSHTSEVYDISDKNELAANGLLMLKSTEPSNELLTAAKKRGGGKLGRRRKRGYIYDPKPLVPKTKTNSLPPSLKDDEYWHRRQRNNEAAKRSRENRRVKELETMNLVKRLTDSNAELKRKIQALEERNKYLEDLLSSSSVGSGSSC